jgi:hypothetical protein
MIRGDMSVTEFVALLWEHKIKVGLLFLAFAVGPGLYDDWQKKRAAEQFEADRRSVDTDASVAGMMLMNAWTSCSQIGIVNDMEGCAKYQARLLQEQAAPMLAKIAIEQRDSYYKNCQRFYAYEYCGQLLRRSVALSNAQSKNNHE